MRIFYKVLSVDEVSHHAIVRFWSDTVTHDHVKPGGKFMGLLDFNVRVDDFDMRPADFDKYIRSMAPVARLQQFERILKETEAPKIIGHVKTLIDKEHSFDALDPAREYSNEELDELITSIAKPKTKKKK